VTRKDAREVLCIMTNADSGCPHCAKELFTIFKKKWPEFERLADEVFETEFDVLKGGASD
jgi:hypothetical protein